MTRPEQRLTTSGVPHVVSGLARQLLRKISVRENVSYGRDLRVGRGVVISAPHRLFIGNWVAIGPRTTIQVDGDIGDFCLIGMSVQIAGRQDHDWRRPGIPMARS